MQEKQQQRDYDFLRPPSKLTDKTEKFRGYSRYARERTLRRLRDDPDSLGQSLRIWLLALFASGPCPMRRVNLLLYCRRAIKTPEFIQLRGGEGGLL